MNQEQQDFSEGFNEVVRKAFISCWGAAQQMQVHGLQQGIGIMLLIQFNRMMLDSLEPRAREHTLKMATEASDATTEEAEETLTKLLEFAKEWGGQALDPEDEHGEEVPLITAEVLQAMTQLLQPPVNNSNEVH